MIHELLATRRSPRQFSDDPIAPQTISALLEAARWAPSSFNEQPWSFLVATRDDPVNHERIVNCLTENNQRWGRSAPLLMITVAGMTFQRTGRPNRHAFHDLGLAVANLTLQATALGLGVHQMAGFDPIRAREAFSIPDGHEAVTAVAIGYPKRPEQMNEEERQRELQPRSRKPLISFVFQGSWGHPAPVVQDSP
jgi:nitroreductase